MKQPCEDALPALLETLQYVTSTARNVIAPAAEKGKAAVPKRDRRRTCDKDAMVALGILIYSILKSPVLRPTPLWRAKGKSRNNTLPVYTHAHPCQGCLLPNPFTDVSTKTERIL